MHYRAPSVLLSVALAATAVVAADLVVFGPQTYTRGVDRPVEVKKTFPVSRPSGQFMLRVVNHGVTSAIITLNGRTILEPKDFTLKRGRPWRDDEWERHTGGWDDDHHGADDPDGRNRDDRDRAGRDRDDRFDHDDEQPVSFLARPVTLRDGANKIVVELRGVPRTSLTVEIVGAGPQPPDDVPPVITTNVDPLPNGNGWNRTNVTVTFSCSDSGSGIETCPAPVTVSTEGANQIVSGTAVDKAGNAATASAR